MVSGRVTAGVLVLSAALFGQSAGPTGASGSSAASGAPVYVLYRLFFRRLAALDAQAAKLDAAGKPGGNALRGEYQKSFFLSDAQAALLKQNAASCNAALDQQHASALPTITAVKASLAALPPGAAAPPPSPTVLANLAALEQARTDISNGCIASLHAALGDRVFTNIDVYVRTKFAQKVSKVPPAGFPSNGQPPTRLGTASVPVLGAPGGGH